MRRPRNALMTCSASGDHRVHFPFGGLDRSYLLHLPPAHGPTTAGDDAPRGRRQRRVRGRGDRLVATSRTPSGSRSSIPRGSPVRPDKEAKFLTNPQEWNDGSGRGRHDDVGFLLAVLDDLAGRHRPGPRLPDGLLERGRAWRSASPPNTRTASRPSPRWPATAGSPTRAVAADADVLSDWRSGPARAACRRDRADAVGHGRGPPGGGRHTASLGERRSGTRRGRSCSRCG